MPWVDVNAALLHHLGQIAVADAVLAVPTDAQQNDLDGKRRRLNRGTGADPRYTAEVNATDPPNAPHFLMPLYK